MNPNLNLFLGGVHPWLHKLCSLLKAPGTGHRDSPAHHPGTHRPLGGPSQPGAPARPTPLFLTSFPDFLTLPWASRLERLCPAHAGLVELTFEKSKGPGWPVWERGSGPLSRGDSAPVSFAPDSLSLPGLGEVAGRGTTFSLCLVSGLGSMGKARVAISLVHSCPLASGQSEQPGPEGRKQGAPAPTLPQPRPDPTLAFTAPWLPSGPGPAVPVRFPWGPLPLPDPPPRFHCHFLPPSSAPPGPEWGEALFPSCGHFPTILSSSLKLSGAKLQAGAEGSPGPSFLEETSCRLTVTLSDTHRSSWYFTTRVGDPSDSGSWGP